MWIDAAKSPPNDHADHIRSVETAQPLPLPDKPSIAVLHTEMDTLGMGHRNGDRDPGHAVVRGRCRMSQLVYTETLFELMT
jgi:hypothetical protein